MPTIITRSEAKNSGLKRYFTGQSCKYGHIADRNIFNGNCIQCDASRVRGRQKYSKQYYEKNKARIYDNFRKYREKHKEKYSSYQKQSRQRNLEKHLARERDRTQKIGNLIAVLRTEMPDLLKEFGL